MPTRPKKTKKLEKIDFEEIEEDEEPESPIIRKKKYVGFNWVTYSASAIGTLIVLWWALK